tara:strand:- start:218 stop:391 length:174 start_codon:yes stop_codon:yes gene_type:complete
MAELKRLKKNVVDTKAPAAAYDADWDSRTAYDDTALTAYCKALQELEDYLEEQQDNG